jgi:DMSO reductase anchor subunit/ferredoxin
VLAYDKDPVTGIVRHLDDQCIGCQYCVMKCPYEVPQYLPGRGIVRKCDMCSARLAVGEAPACVQACPSAAIRITVVEQAKVRGKYRRLKSENRNPKPERNPKTENRISNFGNQASLGVRSSEFGFNSFLPASPNPAITLPTTRYVTQRILPANLEAADAREVQPSKAHPPLTFMLVLSQLGAGLALLGALAGGRSRATALAALLTTLGAVVAGTLHLGQPWKAWRGFLGWRKSWFSRELIAFAAFVTALAAHRAILHPLSSLLAAAFGLAAVACSAMIYVDTRRPYWNAPMTFGKFFGTTLLLGALASAPTGFLGTNPDPPAGMPAFLGSALALFVTGAIVKLAAENRIFHFLVDEQDPQLTALNKTALLLTGRFGLLARVRVACLLASGILLPVLVLDEQLTATTRLILVASALALCFGGELIERHLFFVAEVAPKMPGGGTA